MPAAFDLVHTMPTGYIATIGLLFYNAFGPLSDGNDKDDDKDDNQSVLKLYLNVLWVGGVTVVVALIGCRVYFTQKLESLAEDDRLEQWEACGMENDAWDASVSQDSPRLMPSNMS